MLRVPRTGSVALPLALVLALLTASLASADQRRATGPGGDGPAVLAAVAWPPSSLVVSEVETGGATASDEFAELANTGTLAVDLNGLEVVYVTASGSTVTRKAAWSSSLVLEPGRHLLLANAAGIHAPIADATYSGGFAATGGAVVLRAIGGTTIDAVGWGDATNAFVEGTAAPAPAAGSSLERRPGGLLGNGTDTNDNATLRSAPRIRRTLPRRQSLRRHRAPLRPRRPRRARNRARRRAPNRRSSRLRSRLRLRLQSRPRLRRRPRP